MNVNKPKCPTGHLGKDGNLPTDDGKPIKEETNMRLTTNNIEFVKELTEDGITYNWFVMLKSKNTSDSRHYANYENGRTVVREYRKEDLPKAVQSFIVSHKRELFTQIDDKHCQFIYR